MNAELSKWIKKYVTGKYNDYEFEEALEDLQLLFDLTDGQLDSPHSLLMELAGATDYTPLLKDCIDIEKFMKLLVNLIHPGLMRNPPRPLYPGDTSRTWTLANMYKEALQIVPDNFNLTRAASEISDAEPYRRSPGYLYYYLVAYCCRNKITHSKYEYNIDNENAMVTSYLVTILDLCHRHHDELFQVHETARLLDCFDKEDYLHSIISNYESYEKKGFGYLNVSWYNPDNSRFSNCDAAAIAELNNPHGLKLVGIAGTGKSTILRRIEYLLAQKALKNKKARIPVYIEFADLSDAEDILIEKTASIMNISEADAEIFAARGSLVLLLDGFNEILDSTIKRKLAKELDNLVRNKVPMILTDRTVRSTVPTLQKADCLFLKSISSEEKKLYYTKNCSDPESLKILLDKLETDSDYFLPLDTPLKLKQLMIVVSETGEIPEFLTESYIQCLFERELNEKKDENIDYLSIFLQAVALMDAEKNTLPKILNQMAKCKTAMGYSIPDTQKCFHLAVEMGILVQEENLVSFSSNEYKDYFIIKALENELDELLND